MEKRIYFHDTDAGGIVYYGNYLKYLEEARTEFLEKKNLSVKTFHERGLIYAVSKCTINYKSPARYDDLLTLRTTVTRTWPGYWSVSSIFRAMSRAIRIEPRSSMSCGRTMTRSSRPA